MNTFEEFKTFLLLSGVAYQELIQAIADEDDIEIEEAEENLENTFNTENKQELLDNGFIIYYKGKFAENFKTDWKELREEYVSMFLEDKVSEDIPVISLRGKISPNLTAYYHDKDIPSLKVNDKVMVLNKVYQVFEDKRSEDTFARLINKSGKLSKNKYIRISNMLVDFRSEGCARYFKNWVE